jgi:hypothetical protein
MVSFALQKIRTAQSARGQNAKNSHRAYVVCFLVGEAEQRRAAPEAALWMDAPDFAVAQAGLRIQSSI